MGGHIKTETGFAYGDLAEIKRRSRDVLKEMGVENWNINHTVASYHAKRHDLPCSTTIGRVVREIARKKLKENEEELRRIAELA